VLALLGPACTDELSASSDRDQPQPADAGTPDLGSLEAGVALDAARDQPLIRPAGTGASAQDVEVVLVASDDAIVDGGVLRPDRGAVDAGPWDSGAGELCVPATATPDTLADSVFGFSDQQNRCGWLYGSLNELTDQFTLLRTFSGTSLPHWADAVVNSADLPWIWPRGGHPNTTFRPDPYAADRMWVSTVDARIAIRGNAAKLDPACGDGIRASIRVGGREIWHAVILPYDTAGESFDLETEVVVGARVEFIISANGVDYCDSTTFTATIHRL
jgi:hypothetical protein